MQNLIDDLLLYSRVKTTTIKLREIDLNNLFNRIIMELEADIDEQQAIINLPKVLPTIVGDESLLIQLFSNLIRNAIKFQPPGQQPIVDVELSEDILFWKFSVRDNGIGIDEMNFAKIFGTFEKLHSNDQYEGTGLGLTICRQIVEKHGGLISLSSQKSKGTVFKFGISKKLEVEVVKST
jgi:light-regulated signal transduction histidine kinase (bacteriophytochrome)